MSQGPWARALRSELPAVEAFLRGREERAAGFIGKSLREGRLRLPNPLRGALWRRLDEEEGVTDALLCLPGGLVFPQFSADWQGRGDRTLSEAVYSTGFVPASAVGPEVEVRRFEEALLLHPLVSVAYRLMALRGAPGPRRMEYPRLSLRQAGPADLELLYPLQEAYEREEVATSIHGFNAAGCRAALTKALAERIVVLACLDGHPVGKAGTNARAFSLDQIGGVYVAPPYRGRGIGRAMMEELLGLLAAEGRRAVLFVKLANTPARRLYASLGFEELEDFRADYYMP